MREDGERARSRPGWGLALANVVPKTRLGSPAQSCAFRARSALDVAYAAACRRCLSAAAFIKAQSVVLERVASVFNAALAVSVF